MTDDTIAVIASFPIYKPFRRDNFQYKRKMEKILKSINPRFGAKYSPYIEELNQFIFCSNETDTDSLSTIEKRKKFENKIQTSFDKFASKTLNKIMKMVRKDPEYIASMKAIIDINKGTSADITDKIMELKALPANVLVQVRNLYKDSQMILWDMPGSEIDRIIIGQEIIKFEDTTKVDNTPGDIGSIADELALASLAKNHVPLLSEQLELIHDRITKLEKDLTIFENGLNNFKDEQERILITELASVFLGKLLGIREPLSLALKVMKRYLQLEKEIHIEAEEMDSDMVRNLYSSLIDSNLIVIAIKQADEIINQLSVNAERIRSIYVHVESANVTGYTSSVLQEFALFVSTIYYELEDFRFITELFQDIPSYTSMGGDIVTMDKEEKSVDIPKDTIIYAEGIFKTFPLPSTTVYALRGVDLRVMKGEFLAIMGPSGSGKTTLLNILSGLETSDKGVVHVADLDLRTASEKILTRFRMDTVAFIYQSYNLLPVFTNRENVQLPADLGTNKDIGNRKDRADKLLTMVGLGEYIKGRPNRLSGGQQQRVTIARSLMNKPDILFADEPTGDLDSTTGAQIMDIIEEFRSDGVTIVLVTHDPKVAEKADRVVYMQDGIIIPENEASL